MAKVAIIGMGNMGSKYAVMISEGKIQGMELVAATRIKPDRYEEIKDILPSELKLYQSGDLLFEGYDAGEIEIDTVMIVTPHYSHEVFAIKAFERGLHVLCDKPAGVYSRQARNMMDAYHAACQKNDQLLFGFIFHQRTFPVYQKMREIVLSEKYGKIKRVNWVVTDWYRSNAYYASNSWRASYATDGGGTILNQCPHNIDLLQWICGMPSKVQAFCHEGKYHDIEVEDDVTAYFEWENGSTGVFIASTGEAAGVNRFEISLEDALLVCEGGKLKALELDKPEKEYKNSTGDLFAKPVSSWKEIAVEPAIDPYIVLLNAYQNGEVIADGNEALNGMYIANAIYLSSWEGQKVTLPKNGTKEEKEFEKKFEDWLHKKTIGDGK